MKGINNIKKKISITIFTFLFLIRFIYSEYPTGVSPQNNAVSSLESNSIIQWIITSSTNGYSTVARYLANFISIKGIPIYVWSIITFLMATLFFIAIYLYLFEIFTQRTGISESETMKKAKILLIFTLSVFSAIAIGFAIPFLFNLYGFILLILLLIALFFFGRATVSYGKSFHYAAKSFAANVEKDLLEVERELKKARKNLSEQDVKFLEEGREKIYNDLEKISNEFNEAEKDFRYTLSMLAHVYRDFTNGLAYLYDDYLSKHQNLNSNQIDDLKNLIKDLEHIRDSLHPDIRLLPPLKKLYKDILGEIEGLKNLDDTTKRDLRKILDNTYRTTVLNSQAIPAIQGTISKYENVRKLLIWFYGFENGFKKDFEVRFRHFLGAPDSRKYEIGILSALDKSKNEIERIENLIKERIKFLESLLH
jgi:hypothetical protein